MLITLLAFKRLPLKALIRQMGHSSESGPGASSDVLVDIVETLDTCGLDSDEYQLYEYVDIEAIEQLLSSSSGDVEVQFTVGGVQLAVTPENIEVLSDKEPRTANR